MTIESKNNESIERANGLTIRRSLYIPSAQDFYNGCCQYTRIEDGDGAHMGYEHGVYYIRGFLGGNHFHVAFEYCREARRAFRRFERAALECAQ